jgi:iron complex transport system substrate-binding protein
VNRRTVAALLGLLLSLTLVACGDDDAGSTAADDGAGGAPEQPERIVSLSPTATEMLFAIGAGDAVVAADEHSNHPEDAPTTELSGFQPNVEAIAGHDPDLVVVSNDANDVVAGLESIDVRVLVLPAAASVDDVYEQLRTLGKETGRSSEADELVEEMQEEIDQIVTDAGGAGEGLTYYYELDPTYYSVTSATFIGQVIGLLGLENIADDAQDQSDYPQLSAEYIVQADPDLILLADTKCCDANASTVAERPGWSALSAVQHDGVVELDDDAASRWGPRIVDLLREVAEAVQQLSESRPAAA